MLAKIGLPVPHIWVTILLRSSSIEQIPK